MSAECVACGPGFLFQVAVVWRGFVSLWFWVWRSPAFGRRSVAVGFGVAGVFGPSYRGAKGVWYPGTVLFGLECIDSLSGYRGAWVPGSSNCLG